ncbi:glycosyltransferase family 9 protein [Rhodopila sp.]|uniref:glycosyltransferase family 9 protein n=1 Tax=Rhodopila sp. TaxID=2480087 RepID=UPI002C2CC191|nr:glycosyltransferase family 9 protein [Rhodopila sp.]HVZ08211.1 glycosyltransferase family 9 protein [Rhodopila sp.]
MSATIPAQQPQQAAAAGTPLAPMAAPSAQQAAQPLTASGETPEQALTRAQAAAQAKRLNEALGICQDVLATAPDHPAALALQGIVSAMAGDPEKGVVLLRKAISLRPGNASWYAHLSSLCRMTYRIEEGLAMGQEAIRLDPNNAEHLVNLSLIFVDADDRERATACLLRALGLKHDHADGHLAMAQTLLAQGDFDAGWMEYEWRNLTEAGKATMPPMTSAPWNGMRIPNGRLLLVGDQGYGDTIQFARYIPMVVDRCQELILGCSAEMGPLLSTIPGVTQYCHRWNDVPGHAAHVRLSSLPYLFRTRMDTIPARIPYLKADPARIAHWRERLDAMLPPGLKRIGVAWTGRPTHPNDRRRSMPLSTLAPIGQAGPAAFVSLQKPFPAGDVEAMGLFPYLTDISADLTDFGETAALIENLDLVVTVDTSMGHLAGALGKPVWILIPKAADWRWLLDREDSPWYPTARLFRQQKPGAWEEPLDRLVTALRQDLVAAMPLPITADVGG